MMADCINSHSRLQLAHAKILHCDMSFTLMRVEIPLSIRSFVRNSLFVNVVAVEVRTWCVPLKSFVSAQSHEYAFALNSFANRFDS